MRSQTEEIWRENGSVFVRSRIGSSNYTMLTVMVILLIVPTGLPIFASLLEAFDIGFMGESPQTIAMSIGIAVVSIIPAIVLGRLILSQFRRYREIEIRLEADRLVAPGFKRDWNKVTSVRIGPATRTNFRIAPILLFVKLIDLILINPFKRWLPSDLRNDLDQSSYGVWINGRIVGGVFYDEEVAARLMCELKVEAIHRRRDLDLQQTELAL